ncbi:MAG: hypothetical protein IJ565_04130 [Bacilli bacterium]|nr:hypothetical protein [Bacilli bacterium]
MNYIEVINKINEELTINGVKTIYTLIANDIDIDVIENLIEKNTREYNNLTDNEKEDLIKYLKGLRLEGKLLSIF